MADKLECLVTITNKRSKRKQRRKTELPNVFLFKVDLLKNIVTPISIQHKVMGNVIGMMGVCYYKNGYLIAAQKGKDPEILEVDRDFKVKKIRKTSMVRGTHNISLVDDNTLLIASTSNQSVIEHNLQSGKERCFHPNKPSTPDKIHLNSILWHDNNLYFTAFGQKKSKLWLSATEGYLKNQTENKVLIKPIYQPHTIVAADNTLYFCESARAAVRTVTGQVLEVKKGYTRGLIVTDDYIMVGISSGRVVSESTGVIVESSNPGKAVGACGVMVYKKDKENIANSKFLHFISLERYAEEVYDLLLVK